MIKRLSDCKKILILGCCGSGKSTLARIIGKKLNLPIIHLDQHYWQPGWIETSSTEWEIKLSSLLQKDAWVMDGNYGSTLEMRLEKADAIIYMDVGTIKCLYRILLRTWKYHGKTRPDMHEGCLERFDLDFLHYVVTFNLLRRKKLLSRLIPWKTRKAVIIIKDKSEALPFLPS